MLTIVPVYAAVAALMYVGLSLYVIQGRVQDRVNLGFGESARLERRIRIHGNFAEYVPISLILFAMIEMQRGAVWSVHALCLAMLAGRICHVLGMSEGQSFRFRQAGMLITFGVLIVASMMLLAAAAWR